MTCCNPVSQALRVDPSLSRLHAWFPASTRGTLGVVSLLMTIVGGVSSPAADGSIVIRSFRVTGQHTALEWEGGQPPYRVQAFGDPEYSWTDISGFLFGHSFETYHPWDFSLFRLRTAVDSLPPLAPTGLQVTAARCDRVALTWQPAGDDPEGSGIAGYQLYRDGVKIAELSSQLYLDKDVVPERDYVYAVSSLDRVGNESAPSPALTFATSPCVEPSGPHGELRLRWDASADLDVAGYLVHWGLAPGDYYWAMDAMDYTSITLPDLAPDVTFFFAVTAYDNAGGQSTYSDEVAWITPEIPSP